MRKAIILFSICISLFLVAVAVADVSLEMKRIIKEKYEGKTVMLQKTISQHRKVYVNVSGKELYYVHLKKALFPVKSNKPVTLTEVDFGKDSIAVSFIDEKGKRGRINFYFGEALSDELITKELPVMFNSAFQLEKSEKPFIHFIGNTESKIFHSYGCNHLPDKEHQVLFATRAEAEKAGYRECPVCFKIYPESPDYGQERALGMEMAARLRYYYPLSVKGELQEKLKSVGRKVLANWPFPLKGYSYEFRVLESDDLNAWGGPTGFVFVTSGLLNMVESDEELKAILAREIAHIEQRHGYWEYENVKLSSLAREIVAGIAIGAAVDMRTVQFANVLYNVATGLILFGYNRDNETEADTFAKLYLKKSGKSEEKFLLALKKLRYFEERQGHESPVLLSTHHGIEKRVNRAENSQVGVFESGNIFVGFDSKEKKVAELHLMWEELYAGTHELSAVLTVDKGGLLTPFVQAGKEPVMGISTSLEDMKIGIVCRDSKLEFKVKKAVMRGLNVEILFARDSAARLAKAIDSLAFNLQGIRRWEMLKE